MIMMDEVLTETESKRVMFVEEAHQLQQIYESSEHQAITKTMSLIQNSVYLDVEIEEKSLKKLEMMETL